ncbi:MAG: hypothetical protein ACLFRG_04250 [Desulfococcaceae bacterium]
MGDRRVGGPAGAVKLENYRAYRLRPGLIWNDCSFVIPILNKSRLWERVGKRGMVLTEFSKKIQEFRNKIDCRFLSYLSIFLIQLKGLWKIWEFHDLPFGDTSFYFKNAYRAAENFQIDLAWSPLYVLYYSFFIKITEDAYAATLLHHATIVFILGFMVHFLMRKLLEPSVAWIMTAWWAILPVYFDSLYQVHLFALVPILGSAIVVQHKNQRWARGTALSLSFCTAVLVRNEYVISFLILGLFVVIYEIWLFRKMNGNRKRFAISLLGEYGVPLLLTLIVVLFFYQNAIYKFPELHSRLVHKNKFNVGQGYAFGYKDRNPEWEKEPWLDYGELNRAHFGEELLSFFAMINNNPKRVLEHVLWNIKLLPSGIQMLIFNKISGDISPDYLSVEKNSKIAFFLSGCVFLIIALGAVLFSLRIGTWWRLCRRGDFWRWLVMLSWAPVALVATIIMRPRPSFILPLGIFVLSVVGMCLSFIIHNFKFVKKHVRLFPLILFSVIFLFLPSHYEKKGSHRPLLDLYRNLSPLRSAICRPDNSLLLKTIYPSEVDNYVCPSVDIQILQYSGLDSEKSKDGTHVIPKLFEEYDPKLIYIDKQLFYEFDKILRHDVFYIGDRSHGWKMIALDSVEQWLMVQKDSDFSSRN